MVCPGLGSSKSPHIFLPNASSIQVILVRIMDFANR